MNVTAKGGNAKQHFTSVGLACEYRRQPVGQRSGMVCDVQARAQGLCQHARLTPRFCCPRSACWASGACSACGLMDVCHESSRPDFNQYDSSNGHLVSLRVPILLLHHLPQNGSIYSIASATFQVLHYHQQLEGFTHLFLVARVH